MKRFFPILFLILFLVVIIGANIYLAHRFNFYFAVGNSNIFYLVFPILSILMIFGMMPLSNSTSKPGQIIYILAAITMGTLLYLLISVFMVDLINLFVQISPQISGLAALALALAISGYGIFNAWNIQITSEEIELRELKKDVSVAHISDIHIGHFRGRKFLQRIVNKVNEQNVEAVFITGDLFDGRINLSKENLAPLSELKTPVFFVEGNHDKYTGVQIIKDYLREIGVRVLENEIVNWNGIQIIGLNHMRADNEALNIHATDKYMTIRNVLEKLSIDRLNPAILLHHSPDGIKYANQHGVDLYLAGHTHAGQLFPIKYIANLIFEYNKGLHSFEETKLFVSQGAGTFGPPMRIGTKSEITLLHLKPGK